MKKILLTLLITCLLSELTYAATYKINSSGQLKNNAGKVVGTLPTQIYSGPTVKYIDILVDYSGSMTGVIGKLKKTVTDIVNSIPQSTAVGLRKVGGEFSCAMTQQLTPIETNNAAKLKASLNSTVDGDEPFVLGLQRAIDEDFANLDKTTPKKIIMITDGCYTCKDDPCEYAKRLMAERKDIHIDIIYVKTRFLFFSSYDDRTLSCLANTTGGSIYKAKNLNNIPSVLTKSINTVSEDVAKKLDPQKQYNNYQFLK